MCKSSSTKKLWALLVCNKTLLVNYWVMFVFGYYLFFFMGWLPSFLEQKFHNNITKAGLYTVLPWTFAAILLWSTGNLSDYIFNKFYSLRLARSYLIVSMQLITVLSVIPIIYSTTEISAILFISIAIGFMLSTGPICYAVNIDVAKDHAGTALGVMNTCFAAAGFIAPALTGWVVDVTKSFDAAFILLAALAGASVLLVLVFHQPDKDT